MTEWWQNEGDFRIKGLALVRKSPSSHPHSVIPTHSWMTKLIGMEWKWMGCLKNDIPPFFIFIPWHSRMTSKWRNEEEWGWFWKWAKKLNSEMPLILSSFGHLVIIQECAHYYHSKRQVNPPITLCRGWCLDWLHASPWVTWGHHPCLIPLFLDHSSHAKRQVNPPITLCRGWCLDWLHASPLMDWH